MADVRIFLTTPGAGTWTVPSDCQSATIECIGGGAGGRNFTTYNGEGGGGGAYSKKNSLSLIPGENINYSVGIGGPVNGPNGLGGDTWFKSTSDVLAKGANEYLNTIGGMATNCVGDVRYSGGNGGSSITNGGGGAAGMNGNGNNSIGNYGGGNGDAGYGGIGGPDSYYERAVGGNGTEWDSTHGSGGGGSYGYEGGNYGGGGGGKAVGKQGLIVITYTPTASGSSKFFQLF